MLKFGRDIKKIKKYIRLLSKKIFSEKIYNQIIYFIIKNKFLNHYYGNKLQNNRYKNFNNIEEYKISSQNYEDGIINSLISNLKKNNNIFFEIGVDYYEFNSLQLIKNGWRGLVIDFDNEKIENLNIIKNNFNLIKLQIQKKKFHLKILILFIEKILILILKLIFFLLI